MTEELEPKGLVFKAYCFIFDYRVEKNVLNSMVKVQRTWKIRKRKQDEQICTSKKTIEVNIISIS